MKRRRPPFRGYGSIPHLPGSALGPGEHPGAALHLRPGEHVWVQEKLDGSNVGVWLTLTGELVPVIRNGFPAVTGRRSMHRLFHLWAQHHEQDFRAVLRPGECLAGEWVLLAHGTRYALPHVPFVAFDLLLGTQPLTLPELQVRLGGRFPLPHIYATGWVPPQQVQLLSGGHGALGPPEGLVYRVERAGTVRAVRKWVRPDYQPGKYFRNEDAVLPNLLRPQDQALLEHLAQQAGITDFGGLHEMT